MTMTMDSGENDAKHYLIWIIIGHVTNEIS